MPGVQKCRRTGHFSKKCLSRSGGRKKKHRVDFEEDDNGDSDSADDEYSLEPTFNVKKESKDGATFKSIRIALIGKSLTKQFPVRSSDRYRSVVQCLARVYLHKTGQGESCETVGKIGTETPNVEWRHHTITRQMHNQVSECRKKRLLLGLKLIE